MSGVRIKNLQSVKSVIEQRFDEFEFMVDSPNLKTTLYVSSTEFEDAIGMRKHITRWRRWTVCQVGWRRSAKRQAAQSPVTCLYEQLHISLI